MFPSRPSFRLISCLLKLRSRSFQCRDLPAMQLTRSLFS